MLELLDGSSIVNQLIAIMGALTPFSLFVRYIIKGYREDKRLDREDRKDQLAAMREDVKIRGEQNVFLRELGRTQAELKVFLTAQNVLMCELRDTQKELKVYLEKKNGK